MGQKHSLHSLLRIPRALLFADVDDLADVVGVVGANVAMVEYQSFSLVSSAASMAFSQSV